MMLPPNKPRHIPEGITLTHEPRSIHQITLNTHTPSENWDIMTLGISIESIRAMDGFIKYKYIDCPEARPNLQDWINRLGPALYNPVGWFYRAGRVNRINGNHRMAVLEALDFDVVYVYLVTGDIKYTSKEIDALKVNNMDPTIPTVEYGILVPHK